MAGYLLSPAVSADIEAILAWTHEHFGEAARLRYEALITQGILDLAEDPERVGCSKRPEIAESARTYHLWHSRNRVAQADRVKAPRHFLLFRIGADGLIEIGRVLHESVDLARHLPEGY